MVVDGDINIFYALGDLLNGALQVIADFINVLIDVLPNPDPFPDMINQIAWVNGDVWVFGVFWLDTAVDLSFAVQVLTLWTTLMIASAVFAIIWMLVKWARG